jgi:hypothetical protein
MLPSPTMLRGLIASGLLGQAAGAGPDTQVRIERHPGRCHLGVAPRGRR